MLNDREFSDTLPQEWENLPGECWMRFSSWFSKAYMKRNQREGIHEQGQTTCTYITHARTHTHRGSSLSGRKEDSEQGTQRELGDIIAMMCSSLAAVHVTLDRQHTVLGMSRQWQVTLYWLYIQYAPRAARRYKNLMNSPQSASTSSLSSNVYLLLTEQHLSVDMGGL